MRPQIAHTLVAIVTLTVSSIMEFMDAVIAGNTGYCAAKRRTHCHACRMANPCRAFESCIYKWLCVKRVSLTVRDFCCYDLISEFRFLLLVYFIHCLHIYINLLFYIFIWSIFYKLLISELMSESVD